MVFTGIVEEPPKFGVANVGQFTAARKWVKSFPSNGRHPLICWDKLGQVGTCFKLYGRIDFETALLFLFELL